MASLPVRSKPPTAFWSIAFWPLILPPMGPAGLTDAGHNLSSDASCAFTNPASVNNLDPKLGPLADNGGPTLTMALLPGSPAIDAGDTSLAPTTDQRGFPRPFGLAADIGAYESSFIVPAEVWTLSATAVTSTNATLNASVYPNGYLTVAWFEWGTTTNYGGSTGHGPAWEAAPTSRLSRFRSPG